MEVCGCVCALTMPGAAELLSEGSSSSSLTQRHDSVWVSKTSASGWEVRLCDVDGGSVRLGPLPCCGPEAEGQGGFWLAGAFMPPSLLWQPGAWCQSACVNKASGGEGGS